MNRRGSERMLIVYWFAIIIIVSVAIVSMVNMFYGSNYDVQSIETKILGDVIANCLTQGGLLKDQVLVMDSLDSCLLDFTSQEEKYFVKVEFFDFDSCNVDQQSCTQELRSSLFLGNDALLSYCDQAKGVQGTPACSQRWLYVLSQETVTISEQGKEQGKSEAVKKQVMIHVTSIVNKVKENE